MRGKISCAQKIFPPRPFPKNFGDFIIKSKRALYNLVLKTSLNFAKTQPQRLFTFRKNLTATFVCIRKKLNRDAYYALLPPRSDK
jgi:hypothetical protein